MGALTNPHIVGPSLYAQFIKEVHGLECIEYSWGYATYELGQGYVYLIDVYIVPEERAAGKGPQLMEEVAAIGKQAGATRIFTSVAINSRDPKKNYEIIQRHGFQASHEDADNLYLVKDI